MGGVFSKKKKDKKVKGGAKAAPPPQPVPPPVVQQPIVPPPSNVPAPKAPAAGSARVPDPSDDKGQGGRPPGATEVPTPLNKGGLLEVPNAATRPASVSESRRSVDENSERSKAPEPNTNPEIVKTVVHNIVNLIKTLNIAPIPVLDSVLKAIVKSIDLVESNKENEEALKTFEQQFQEFYDVVLKPATQETSVPEHLYPHIDSLDRELQVLFDSQDRNFGKSQISLAIDRDGDAKFIRNLIAIISRAVERFQTKDIPKLQTDIDGSQHAAPTEEPLSAVSTVTQVSEPKDAPPTERQATVSDETAETAPAIPDIVEPVEEPTPQAPIVIQQEEEVPAVEDALPQTADENRETISDEPTVVIQEPSNVPSQPEDQLQTEVEKVADAAAVEEVRDEAGAGEPGDVPVDVVAQPEAEVPAENPDVQQTTEEDRDKVPEELIAEDTKELPVSTDPSPLEVTLPKEEQVEVPEGPAGEESTVVTEVADQAGESEVAQPLLTVQSDDAAEKSDEPQAIDEDKIPSEPIPEQPQEPSSFADLPPSEEVVSTEEQIKVIEDAATVEGLAVAADGVKPSDELGDQVIQSGEVPADVTDAPQIAVEDDAKIPDESTPEETQVPTTDPQAEVEDGVAVEAVIEPVDVAKPIEEPVEVGVESPEVPAEVSDSQQVAEEDGSTIPDESAPVVTQESGTEVPINVTEDMVGEGVVVEAVASDDVIKPDVDAQPREVSTEISDSQQPGDEDHSKTADLTIQEEIQASSSPVVVSQPEDTVATEIQVVAPEGAVVDGAVDDAATAGELVKPSEEPKEVSEEKSNAYDKIDEVGDKASDELTPKVIQEPSTDAEAKVSEDLVEEIPIVSAQDVQPAEEPEVPRPSDAQVPSEISAPLPSECLPDTLATDEQQVIADTQAEAVQVVAAEPVKSASAGPSGEASLETSDSREVTAEDPLNKSILKEAQELPSVSGPLEPKDELRSEQQVEGLADPADVVRPVEETEVDQSLAAQPGEVFAEKFDAPQGTNDGDKILELSIPKEIEAPLVSVIPSDSGNVLSTEEPVKVSDIPALEEGPVIADAVKSKDEPEVAQSPLDTQSVEVSAKILEAQGPGQDRPKALDQLAPDTTSEAPLAAVLSPQDSVLPKEDLAEAPKDSTVELVVADGIVERVEASEVTPSSPAAQPTEVLAQVVDLRKEADKDSQEALAQSTPMTQEPSSVAGPQLENATPTEFKVEGQADPAGQGAIIVAEVGKSIESEKPQPPPPAPAVEVPTKVFDLSQHTDKDGSKVPDQSIAQMPQSHPSLPASSPIPPHVNDKPSTENQVDLSDDPVVQNIVTLDETVRPIEPRKVQPPLPTQVIPASSEVPGRNSPLNSRSSSPVPPGDAVRSRPPLVAPVPKVGKATWSPVTSPSSTPPPPQHLSNVSLPNSQSPGAAAVENSDPFQRTDSDFIKILDDLIPKKDVKQAKEFQDIVGTIVMLQDPLPLATLAKLLRLPEKKIQPLLKKLHGANILSAEPKDQNPIAVYPSLSDFLISRKRCTDRFLINPGLKHSQIATLCLSQMASLLPNGENYAEASLPPNLKYCCLYWTSHVGKAPTTDAKLCSTVASFCKVKLSKWLVAVRVLGKLDVATTSLTQIDKYFTVQNPKDIKALQNIVRGCQQTLQSGQTGGAQSSAQRIQPQTRPERPTSPAEDSDDENYDD